MLEEALVLASRLVVRAALAALALALSLPAFAEDAAAPEEDPGWKTTVALGATISSGTTDSFGGSIDAATGREWEHHKAHFGLFASYGRTDGGPSDAATTQSNEQRLTQAYRYIPRERFYWYVALEEARDPVRNIELRLLASTGPGYRVWHVDDKNLFDVEVGVGYRYEDYGNIVDLTPGIVPPALTPTPEFEPSRNDVNGRAAFNYLRMFGVAEFGQSGEFLLPFNDTKGWIARGTTRLSFPIVDGWAFANTLALEYFNDPPKDSEKFELDYIVSLVLAF